jgi:hypothetical protein
MSDETMVEETGLDSSAIDTGASLQEEMTGDFFFDDGMDAVVNGDGLPFAKEDGSHFKSLEEYQQSLNPSQSKQQPATQPPLQKPQPAPAQNNANAKTNVGKTPQPVSGFDAYYNKNGLDLQSMIKDTSKFNAVSYQRTVNPLQQQQPQPQQPEVPVDPVKRDEAVIAEYHESLRTGLLGPLEEVYNSVAQFYKSQGVNVPDEVYNAFNSRYSHLNEQVNKIVNQKDKELIEARHKEDISARDYKVAETNRDRVMADVANEFFPETPNNQRMDRLNKLIFGYTDKSGKIIRGYGADAVDHAFDIAHDGKEFKTDKEWSDAYVKWWTKYASNPNNVKHIAQRAWDRFIANNLNNARDSWRSAWDNEQREKLKHNQQAPGASKPGGGIATDEDAALSSYFKV